jgi:precorrin-6Y C5,15-methyltransferase (decarboxylating)
MTSTRPDAAQIHPWLSIVGIGEDGWDGLAAKAKSVVADAEIVYGGSRHLAFVPEGVAAGSKIPWPSPMKAAVDEILTVHRARRKVAVLASGDPMLHGVGVTLTRELAPTEYVVLPQVSAFSLACARLGWPASETKLVSVVHRSMEEILRELSPGQRLVVFSEDGQTPAAVAELLTRHGYGSSHLHVLERMGGPCERHLSNLAVTWDVTACAGLNVIAFVCAADAGVQPLSLAPGLRDEAYEGDGQLTKREVRAATLARLAPLPGQRLWDVGAGTGTIGIEWMRLHPSCSCVAFEERNDRADQIAMNASRLGVPELKVVRGVAPNSFAGVDAPDAIFIGGGLSKGDLLQACWDRLAPGGRLVANAVTLDSEARLAAWHGLHGGELVRLQVARAEQIGASYVWRPMMPITQWAGVKP